MSDYFRSLFPETTLRRIPLLHRAEDIFFPWRPALSYLQTGEKTFPKEAMDIAIVRPPVVSQKSEPLNGRKSEEEDPIDLLLDIKRMFEQSYQQRESNYSQHSMEQRESRSGSSSSILDSSQDKIKQLLYARPSTRNIPSINILAASENAPERCTDGVNWGQGYELEESRNECVGKESTKLESMSMRSLVSVSCPSPSIDHDGARYGISKLSVIRSVFREDALGKKYPVFIFAVFLFVLFVLILVFTQKWNLPMTLTTWHVLCLAIISLGLGVLSAALLDPPDLLSSPQRVSKDEVIDTSPPAFASFRGKI